MTNNDFEDEEMLRLAEEQKGGLRPGTFEGDAENIAALDAELREMKTLPEPYDYEGCSPWSMTIIKGVVAQFFCMNCKHRYHHTFGCAQGTCDTLERLENRLWRLEE